MRVKTEQQIVPVTRRIDIRNRKQSFIDCKDPVNVTVHLTDEKGSIRPLTTRAREVWTLQQNIDELVAAGACDGDGFFFKGDFIAALINGQIVGKSAKVAFKLNDGDKTPSSEVENAASADETVEDNFEDWPTQVYELNDLENVEAGAGRDTDESEHNELNDFAAEVLAVIDEPVSSKSSKRNKRKAAYAQTELAA
jgi:hypothetical protein